MNYNDLTTKWSSRIVQPNFIRFYEPENIGSYRANYLEHENKICSACVTPIEKYDVSNNARINVESVNSVSFAMYFNAGTYEELLADLLDVLNDVENAYTSAILTESTITDKLEKWTEYTSQTIQFNTRSNSLGGYTELDKKYIFDNVVTDEYGNKFFKLDDKYYNLKFKEDSTMVLQDPEFCKLWWDSMKDTMREWDKKIIKVLNKRNGVDNLENELLKQGVPKFYLEMVSAEVVYRLEVVGKKKEKILDHVRVVLNNGNSPSQTCYQTQNIISVVSRNLFTSVCKDKTRKLESFSNTMGEGIVFINRPLPVERKNEPKLPVAWFNFLDGKFTQKIDYFKLAYFVTSVLDCDNYGRQALVLSGEGTDGKGVMLEALLNIVGQEVSVAMQYADFTDNDRFGINKAFMRKFATLTDCRYVGKLFGCDKFKQITGGDKLTLEAKFQNPITWANKGFKIAIATNNQYSISDEYSASRLIPIAVKKNYVIDKPKWKLIDELMLEKEQFVQWAYDYVKYHNDKTHGQLVRGGRLTVCTDDRYEQMCREEVKLTETQLLTETLQVELLKGKPVARINKYTEDEEEDKLTMIECLMHDGFIEKATVCGDDNKHYLSLQLLFSELNKAYLDVDKSEYNFFTAHEWHKDTAYRSAYGKKICAYLEDFFESKIERIQIRGERKRGLIRMEDSKLMKEEVKVDKDYKDAFETMDWE